MSAKIALLALAAGGLSTMAQAAYVELAGNVFHQNGLPATPNVTTAVNNPQNMGGGGWIGGSTSNYPVGTGSPVLDGDVHTGWGSGTFSGGAMCNFAMTQGTYYTVNNPADSFTNTPYGAINRIRIWASNWINDDTSSWIAFPKQVKVAYTTGAFNPGNGYSYNSGTLGVTPAIWGTDGSITAVNGLAPVAPANGAYATGLGWVDLTAAMIVDPSLQTNYHQNFAYVDLDVSIPAGATSILLSFGEANTSTGNQGGLNITEVQGALVPEPTSMAAMALAAGGLLIRRRKA